MQRKHALALPFLLLALIGGAAPVTAGALDRFIEGEMEGTKLHAAPRALPPIRFRDSQERLLGLADFRGKVVLLTIWATWCPYCRMDMPHVNDLQARYGAEGLAVVPVSVDAGGWRDVDLYYRKKGISNLPIYVDPHSEVGTALGTGGLPYFILIDRNGNEVARKAGETNWMAPEAQKLIQALLEEK